MPCEGLPPRHDDPEPKLDIGAHCINSCGGCARGCLQILVHKGLVGDVRVYPRDVFCEAIRWRAAAVVVAHNHPSGDPTPSEDDIALTKELIEIGRLHKIPVIDHLVLAKRGADAGTFVSIRNLAVLSFG